MRRPSILAAFAAVVLAACAGAPTPTVTDPYAVVQRALQTPWHQVQVNVGASVKSGGATVSLDPTAIQVVVDNDAGKGSVHVSLPTAALGIDAVTAGELGVTGSTLDVDALYDGSALYAKSPVLKLAIGSLLAGSGDMPSGDLGGWLRLATKADLDALAASGSAPTAPPSFDAASLKPTLATAGITLSFAGTSSRNGADEDHVTAAVDVNKLLDSPAFDSSSRAQINQVRTALQGGSLAFDLWTDHASGRLAEIDAHASVAGSSGGSGDLTVTFTTPASGASFTAPGSYVDVPARTLVGDIFKLVGGSISG